MWTRRQFLSAAGLGLAAGASFALPGDGPIANENPEAVPDGSASKGMITPEADQAIKDALSYLHRTQHQGGSFGYNAYHGNVAVTSLAGLAFMSGGHQPSRGPYGQAVTEALRFVLSMENKDGVHAGYLHNPLATPHGPMYGHGFGTLFLAEVSGMVHDRDLRQEVQKKLHDAVDLILRSQNRDGGWRYLPESTDADLSVTVCQIMALRAARNAGVGVPKEKVDKCVEYVRACQDRQGGWFRYMKQGGGAGMQGFARTAAGVAALYSAGIYKGSEIQRGLEFLVNARPQGFFGGRPDMHYFYGHYYAMQAMWTAGGPYWSDWYPKVRDDLLRQKSAEGSWSDQIDTHYATAMAAIILQVPNNYLTILQK